MTRCRGTEACGTSTSRRRPVPYADHFMCHQWSKLKPAETAVAHDRHGTDANYLFIDGHVESRLIQETFDPDVGRNLWNPSRAR